MAKDTLMRMERHGKLISVVHKQQKLKKKKHKQKEALK